ncbi:MAG: FeoB-associated Cys-rich membrane protein [Oscillospiraceae bacterium]|nr:FeoB-associated Cys-rich membrane protein [Oscillospiraceae bacterium]MBQ7130417.1 FeoB-associated Cys-rich membrane protein [Oscillospiraceae bacterium]
MTVGDIIVLAVLAGVIGLIIRGMIRDKKQGNCCGCSGCSAGKNGCAGCAGCSGCAEKNQ